ncbi:MAG: (R,R)-butanediol dehydrogenase / meso-butanediol dehydrogenase / diacetyl reductase [Acidimicrobiaceae bacterium]|nr:(R,R)-butanediol dehydrogenase / meso-butanediol dehydrogenase / diacetyl reductase [Acidimicrobiaceae bacterium]
MSGSAGMQAVRWWGRGDVRVDEVDQPGEPRAGWVRLRVVACGICGTDVEEFTSGPVLIPTSPHPITGRCAPLTLGHEAAGVVDAVGPGVGLDVGTLVAVESNLFCGTCWWCRRGRYQLCPDLANLGLMGDGGLAEYMAAPAQMCIPFTNAVSPEHAAMTEPLSVAVRAVTRAGVGLGSSVVVLGAGTVGLLAVQAARLAGAERVVVVENVPSRRALALGLELGADLAVGAVGADGLGAALEAVRSVSDGRGADVAIEAAGNAAAAAAAVRLVRRGGRAVLLGVFDDTVPIDMKDLLLGEKTVTASLSHVYDEDFATAVSLIDRGAVALDPLITDRIGLADVVDKGFNALVAEPGSHLKVIVLPGS